MSDNESDLAFREVDEALLRQKLEERWKQYRVWILGGAFALVAGVAGNEIYLKVTESARAARSDVFATANRTAIDDDAKAGTVWEEAAKSIDGSYANLALYRAAAAKYDAGDVEGALAAFEGLGQEGTIDPALRDLARLNAAMIAADELEDFLKAKSLLQLVSGDGKPWAYSAREVLASIAMKEGNLDEALETFTALELDQNTPQTIRQRASQFLSRLRLQTQQKATETPVAEPEIKPEASETGSSEGEAGSEQSSEDGN